MPVRNERYRPCLCYLLSSLKLSPVHWLDTWSKLSSYGDTLLHADTVAQSILPSGTGECFIQN